MNYFDESWIKKEFPAFEDLIYFNTGIVGIMPKTTVEKMAEVRMEYDINNWDNYDDIRETYESLRTDITNLTGAEDADSLCFTRNATEGINIALSSIEYNENDNILISDQEHPALLFPTVYRKQKEQISELKRFKIDKDPDKTLQSFSRQLNENTKIVAFSHVSSQTGIRLPVKKMTELTRENGSKILIDGAQVVGNIPLSLQNIEYDFYVGNGHKWLCGPRGTSFLYINCDRIDEFKPAFVGAGSAKEFDSDNEELIFHKNALKFEYGTRDRILFSGLKTNMDLYEKWGWQKRQEKIKDLSTYLKEELKQIPGCTLHTPVAWDLSSGNVTFSLHGESPWEILNENSIKTRPVVEFNATRVSTNYYNTFADIEKLITVIKDEAWK